jgi:hypothetical protein
MTTPRPSRHTRLPRNVAGLGSPSTRPATSDTYSPYYDATPGDSSPTNDCSPADSGSSGDGGSCGGD